MSGKVPPSSRANLKRKARNEVEKARNLIESFTGHDADFSIAVDIPPIPKNLVIVGLLDSIEYTTVRDGKREAYRHEFMKSDGGLLCASADGKRLFIVDGKYKFTKLGIVDASDKKNMKRASA